MKKTFLLTICLLIVSFTSFAGKLAMIPVSETQNLETLFADHNLKIHYYCDDYVLATAESLSYDNAVVLDEHAFKEVDSYAIVYCYNDYKEEYLAKIDGSVETLYSGEHFFIMKLIGDGFMPAKNDGTVVIRDREAQLCKSTFDYPIVTEPDENILNLISQVSTDSLIAVVQHLQDYVTRDCQHTNIVNVRNWLKSKYDNLDLEVTFHNFPYYNNSNVIAIQYGTELPDEYIVCGAHYDSKTWNPPNPEVAPGADDNATGTAGIMEIAKILSQYDFKRSIIYCAFSGEEYGLYGSDYYAQQCASQGMDILGYFNIDMSGYLNPNASNITISIIRPAMAAPLDDYYTNVANIYFPQVNITHHASMYGDSDHSSFCTNGYQGIYPFENNDSYSPYIHTPNDIIGVSVNNQEQVRVYTQVSLACIATLAVLADSIISPPPTPLPILALSKTSSSVEVFNEETVDDYITVYNLGDTTLTFEIRDIVIECGTYDGKLINIEPVEGMVESGDSLIITLSYFFPLLVKTVDFEYLGSFIFICNDSTQLETEISLHALAHQSESINEAMISKIKIYPNPANNELRVTSSNNKEINPLVIEIYDVYGRKIMAKFPSNKLEGWQSKADGVVFDISHLTSGVYFIKIANEWVGKFIKQ